MAFRTLRDLIDEPDPSTMTVYGPAPSVANPEPPPVQAMAPAAPARPAGPSFRERYYAQLAGQNPFEVRARQQEAASLQAARAAQTENNILTAIEKTPAGQRQPQIKIYERFLQTQGRTLDPEVGNFFKKAEQDELNAAKWAVGELRQQYPGLESNELWEALNTRPDLQVQWFSLIEQKKKAAEETKGKELENKLLQGALDAANQPSPDAVEPTSAQPGSSIPVQPNVAPGGPQVPSRPIRGLGPVQQQIAEEAQRQGVDPALALAIAENESSFNFVSGDGGKAAGYFQLHDRAAQDAGQALGMDPNARHTPEGNIRLGVAYIKDTLRRAGGNPQGAMALYNWGRPEYAGQGNPRYVQDVSSGLGRYTKLIGGRPASQAVQSAPPEYQQRLGQLNAEITRRQQLQDARRGMTVNPKLRAMWDAEQELIKGLATERDNLQKQFEAKPADASTIAAGVEGVPLAPNMRTQQDWQRVDARLRQDKESEQAAKRRESAAQGVEAQDNKLLTPEEIEQYEGTEPGWTQGMLRQALGSGKVKYQAKLPTERQKALDGHELVYKSADRLIERLQDPKTLQQLAPVIGSLLSNPQAWYERAVKGRVEGLTPEQQRFAASLAFQMVTLRKELLGTAVSRGEEESAKPFLASLDSATPDTLLSTLQAIQDAQYLAHTSIRESAQSLKQRVPPALGKPKGYDLAPKEGSQNQPVAQTPSPTGKAPNPIALAIQQEQERRRQTGKR